MLLFVSLICFPCVFVWLLSFPFLHPHLNLARTTTLSPANRYLLASWQPIPFLLLFLFPPESWGPGSSWRWQWGWGPPPPEIGGGATQAWPRLETEAVPKSCARCAKRLLYASAGYGWDTIGCQRRHPWMNCTYCSKGGRACDEVWLLVLSTRGSP